MKVEILYEDDDLLAINKPAGLVVHFDGRTNEETLIDWIINRYPEAESVGEPIVTSSGKIINRPGIVHRLDRETSGVMLVAKTKKGHAHLKKQFKNRLVEKEYHCFAWGVFSNDKKEGIIDFKIGRNKRDFRRFAVERAARGELREAETEYKVFKDNGELSFVQAIPKTGRTHQIRVHFQAISHPLVCDKLYAPKKPCALGFERVALHAFAIKFRKVDGSILRIRALYPPDFSKALETVGFDSGQLV
jgi:23S rRNA pseudouridine1911/1915/1917 synthase